MIFSPRISTATSTPRGSPGADCKYPLSPEFRRTDVFLPASLGRRMDLSRSAEILQTRGLTRQPTESRMPLPLVRPSGRPPVLGPGPGSSRVTPVRRFSLRVQPTVIHLCVRENEASLIANPDSLNSSVVYPDGFYRSRSASSLLRPFDDMSEIRLSCSPN